MTDPLAFSLDRDLVIRAPRALVFRYFTDPERWAAWWGTGSTIDARAGGALQIVYPGGVTASGVVLELAPDERIAFTFGYDSGAPIAPGGSRVTITLADHPEGTHLALRHDVADAATRDLHVQGWRYQLAVFANVVANEAHASAAERVDRWFAAWNAPADALAAAFDGLVTPGVAFRDGFACVRGVADLAGHVAAARVHLPGVTLRRDGAPRHCQGTVLADWTAQGPDGKTVGRGTNVFELAADGRIERVVGFWRG
jgi:uncharacterized protein YndB with AHSA1/START domain